MPIPAHMYRHSAGIRLPNRLEAVIDRRLLQDHEFDLPSALSYIPPDIAVRFSDSIEQRPVPMMVVGIQRIALDGSFETMCQSHQVIVQVQESVHAAEIEGDIGMIRMPVDYRDVPRMPRIGILEGMPVDLGAADAECIHQ